MKVSLRWLEQFVDLGTLGIPPETLAQSLTMVGLAVDRWETVEDDVVFELDITSNRPDCLNHLGVARELAAQFRLPLRRPDFSAPPADPTSQGRPVCPVTIEDPDRCPRYAGRVISGVRVEESPEWLRRRLELVGQRPINNVVDITNYVLFEVGHPLHAFDLERLHGPAIVVRTARSGERLKTLDGVDRTLEPDMLMICDAREPVAVAGVMGGESSEISLTTSSLFLESAWFEPRSVRSTAKRLGLSTEASYRFERGADPDLPVAALNLATRMIVEICGGRCVGPVIDVHPRPHQPLRLCLTKGRIRQVLGIAPEIGEVEEVLRALDFRTERLDTERLTVQVPGFRSDIELEDDLVEEFARHHGYDRIPSRYPAPGTAGVYPPHHAQDRLLEDTLVGLGFYQAMNFSFSTPERERIFRGEEPSMVAIQNPLSDADTHLRTTLVPGLVESLRRNLNVGVRDVRLFEIGNVYRPEGAGVREEARLGLLATGGFHEPYWGGSKEAIGFFHLKGMLELLFRRLGVAVEFRSQEGVRFLHPGVGCCLLLDGEPLGVMGELHPSVCERFKFTSKICVAELNLETLYCRPLPEPRYTSLNRFPAVERDVSFLLDRRVPFSRIQELVQSLGIAELRTLRLIDLYHGPGLPQDKVSLTVRLIFEDRSRTLQQAEVGERCDRVVAALTEHFGIERR